MKKAVMAVVGLGLIAASAFYISAPVETAPVAVLTAGVSQKTTVSPRASAPAGTQVFTVEGNFSGVTFK